MVKIDIWQEKNIRNRQEDACSIIRLNNDTYLAIVCDGLGGHPNGDKASHDTVEYIVNKAKEYKPVHYDKTTIYLWLIELVLLARAELQERSRHSGESIWRTRDTTLVLALVTTNKCYVLNIGDSTAALYIKDSYDKDTVMKTVSQGIGNIVHNTLVSCYDQKICKYDSYVWDLPSDCAWYLYLYTDGLDPYINQLDPCISSLDHANSCENICKEALSYSTDNITMIRIENVIPETK